MFCKILSKTNAILKGIVFRNKMYETQRHSSNNNSKPGLWKLFWPKSIEILMKRKNPEKYEVRAISQKEIATF